MATCPTERIVRIIEGVRSDLDVHARDCGDRPVGVALHPDDHAVLCLAEVWGLPVLAWGEVRQGHYTLLCEANGVLIPDVDTFEELADRWAFGLQRPQEPRGIDADDS